MRLGTLARKISITPSKLTAFLESQNIDLSSGTNTKLNEEEIELVLDHYKAALEEEKPEPEVEVVAEVEEESPALEQELIEENTSEIEETETEILEEEEKESKEEEKKKEEPRISESFVEIALPHELEDAPVDLEATKHEPIEEDIIQESESQEDGPEEVEYVPQVPEDLDPDIESYVERLAYDENIEVIKPAKVKLQGLTVKGKIDLPEPKVETEKTEEPKKEEKKAYDPDEIITTTGPRRDRKRKPKNYKGKKFNKDYNPLEAARKKKEWEEKKRKEQEERRKKKAKAKHYKKNVKPASATPTAKKKPKKVTAKKKQLQEQQTGNMLQRFWRWMNT
ncbi:hypothetical protein [Reichenbachiella sp.]|uniref:hypothetical protein n=1 Tax=Reichenbachiella sp. TaxID=2184521 RepID=UPI003B5ADB44